MNDSIFRRLLNRLGIVGLALTLMAAAVGFLYVARLTQTASTARDSAGTPIALFVLAAGSAIAGIGALRLAVDRSDHHDLF